MDWQQLEDECFAAARREILVVLRKNPRDTFHVAAIHDSYRELDGRIWLPCLALDSVQKLRKRQGSDNLAYDYAPPNWRWSFVNLKSKRLNTLVEALQAEANRSTQNHWRRTEKRFLSTMVRVAKRLYAALNDHPHTTEDFLVFFDDKCGNLEIIRKCLPRALFLKHFGEKCAPQQCLAGRTSLPIAEKMRAYLEDYEKWEAEIMKPGEQTIDGLIANLKDDEVGWVAARHLGRMANSSSKVIRALRREVRRCSDGAMWSALALGMLGDAKHLLKLVDDKATRDNAVAGLTAPLKACANESIKPIPLDYHPLECLFTRKSAACAAIVNEEIGPGSALREITATDIDEALRGLRSRHLAIRQHAVCILGDRSLGKQAAKKVLPALVEMLKDPHPNVRRLAILSIACWKAAAGPYRAEIKKMEEDSDADVRRTACSAWT